MWSCMGRGHLSACVVDSVVRTTHQCALSDPEVVSRTKRDNTITWVEHQVVLAKMAAGLLKFYLRKAILFRRNCLLLLAILLVFGVLVVRITNELTSVERSLAHVKDATPQRGPAKVSIPVAAAVAPPAATHWWTVCAVFCPLGDPVK